MTGGEHEDKFARALKNNGGDIVGAIMDLTFGDSNMENVD